MLGGVDPTRGEVVAHRPGDGPVHGALGLDRPGPAEGATRLTADAFDHLTEPALQPSEGGRQGVEGDPGIVGVHQDLQRGTARIDGLGLLHLQAEELLEVGPEDREVVRLAGLEPRREATCPRDGQPLHEIRRNPHLARVLALQPSYGGRARRVQLRGGERLEPLAHLLGNHALMAQLGKHAHLLAPELGSSLGHVRLLVPAEKAVGARDEPDFADLGGQGVPGGLGIHAVPHWGKVGRGTQPSVSLSAM